MRDEGNNINKMTDKFNNLTEVFINEIITMIVYKINMILRKGSKCLDSLRYLSKYEIIVTVVLVSS